MAKKDDKKCNEAQIRIYGVIGDQVSGNQVAEQMAELDDRVDTISLLINSNGGSVSDGLSIISAILTAKSFIHVYVNGIAASMAAVIAVAADKVTMQDYAKLMIHDPFFSGQGSDKLSAKDKKALDSITDTLQTLLSRRGCTKEKIASLMKEETWFTADEAKAAGLIDEVVSTPRKEELAKLTVTELMSRIMNEYRSTTTKKVFKMNEIAKALGLPEDATEQQILDALKARKESFDARMKTIIDRYMALGEKSGFVNEKNKEKMQRLAAKDFELFVEMIQDAIETKETKVPEEETLTEKPKDQRRLSDVISKTPVGNGKSSKELEHDYDWYQKHNPQALVDMEKADPAKFNRLLDEYERKIEG